MLCVLSLKVVHSCRQFAAVEQHRGKVGAFDALRRGALVTGERRKRGHQISRQHRHVTECIRLDARSFNDIGNADATLRDGDLAILQRETLEL